MAPMAKKKPRVKWTDSPEPEENNEQLAKSFTSENDLTSVSKAAVAGHSIAVANDATKTADAFEKAEQAYTHAPATSKTSARDDPHSTTDDAGERITIMAPSITASDSAPSYGESAQFGPVRDLFYRYEGRSDMPKYPAFPGTIRATDEDGGQLYVREHSNYKPAFFNKADLKSIVVPSDVEMERHQQGEHLYLQQLHQAHVSFLAGLRPCEQGQGEALLNTIDSCQQRLQDLLAVAMDYADVPAPSPEHHTSTPSEQQSYALHEASAPDETVVATDGEEAAAETEPRGRSRTRYVATSGYDLAPASTASLYQDAYLRAIQAHYSSNFRTLPPLVQASYPDAHQLQVHEESTGKIRYVNLADFPRGHYRVTSDYRRERVEEERFFPWRFDEHGLRKSDFNNCAYEYRDRVTEQACRDGNNPTSKHNPFIDGDTPIDPDEIPWGINPKPIQVKDYRSPAEIAAAEAQETKNKAYRPPQLRTNGFRSYAEFKKYAEEPGRKGRMDSSWKPPHLREYHETVHGWCLPLEMLVEENVKVSGYNLVQERVEGGRTYSDPYSERKAQAIHDWWVESQQREPSLMHNKGSSSNVTNGNDPSMVSASSGLVENIKNDWAEAREASPPLAEQVESARAASPEGLSLSAQRAIRLWAPGSKATEDPSSISKADRMKGNWRQPAAPVDERADSGYGKANKGKLPVRESGSQWVKSSHIKPIPRAPTINWEGESSVASSSTRGWGKRNKQHLQPWQTDEPLGDWSGNWNPPPLDWDMRPAFRNDQSKEGIDCWLEGLYSVRTFEALAQLDCDLRIEDLSEDVLHGECAPTWWHPETFGDQGYKEMWAEVVASQEPAPLEENDLEDVWPWWERYFQTEEGENMHFLLPLDQPHTLGVDPDNETAQQTQSRENDHGSLQHAENRKRQELAKREALHHRQAKAKEIAKTAVKLQHDSDSLHPVQTKPNINMYIRAAIKDDMPAVLKLYNSHVCNSFSAPETSEIDFYEIAMRFTLARAAKLPFLVALERAVQPPKTVKGKLSRYADITITDKVIGFAFAAPYHGTSIDGTFSSAAKLGVWTDRIHLRKGIAKCLIDKLLSTLDSGYIEKCDVEFQSALAITTATRERNVKNLFIDCYFEAGKEHKFWVAKWLEGTVLGPGFSRAGGHEGIGEKFGKKVSSATFHKATAAAWQMGGQADAEDEGGW